MDRKDYNEKLRIMLSTLSLLQLPNHEATDRLLESLFDDEEARIAVLGLSNINTPVGIESISDATGILVPELSVKLEEMANKGLIVKASDGTFMARPYYPGIMPDYYIYQAADLGKMVEVSKANHDLLDISVVQEWSDRKYSPLRVIPAIEPIERTIEINEKVEPETAILPFEVLEEQLSKVTPQAFAIIPCGCREVSRLSNAQCERTTENFCVAVGGWAEELNSKGYGRKVTSNELMPVFESAEKAGLVHQVANMQEGDPTLICNCCPCCCPYLRSYIYSGGSTGATAKSNFRPECNSSLCRLCEKCSQLCPVDAIYHHFPHQEDGKDDYMLIRHDICLGCGICASNCPNSAISLRKVSDTEPPKDLMEMYVKTIEGRTH